MKWGWVLVTLFGGWGSVWASTPNQPASRQAGTKVVKRPMPTSRPSSQKVATSKPTSLGTKVTPRRPLAPAQRSLAPRQRSVAAKKGARYSNPSLEKILLYELVSTVITQMQGQFPKLARQGPHLLLCMRLRGTLSTFLAMPDSKVRVLYQLRLRQILELQRARKLLKVDPPDAQCPGALALLKKAAPLINERIGWIQELQNSMSQEQLTFVTSDNPSSIYRKIGKIAIYSELKTECKSGDYAKLIKEFGLGKMVQNHGFWSLLANYYEDLHKVAYLRRLQTWFQHHPPKEMKGLWQRDFFAVILKFSEQVQKPGLQRNRSMIRQIETKVMESGIKRGEIKKVVGRAVSLAPHCLATAGSGLDRLVSRSLTIVRGRWVLGQIRAWFASGKKSIVGFNIKVVPGHPIYQNNSDGWGNAFRIEQDPEKVLLKSDGPDKKDPKDDMVLGFVSRK